MREVKFIPMGEFKATNDGAGGFKGYVTKFGELDDVGDIILAGAYADTIPQFLKRGFTADSHDWSFGGGMIGYPVSAKEDKIGLMCETRFHSTPDAQAVRTKAQERQAAGLDTFLSIGYELAPNTAITVHSHDYASELPKYSSPDLLESNMERAKQFNKVRIIPKCHLYEYSLVTVPALRSASVTGVKALEDAAPINIKGMFEDALAEQTNDLYNLFNVLCCVLCDIDQQEDMADAAGIEYDYEGALREALGEFTERVVANALQEEAEEEAEEGMTDGDGENEINAQMTTDVAAIGLRALRLADGHSYVAQLKAVGDAAGRLLTRTRARREMRLKEGRMLSTQNEGMLATLRDSLRGHADSVDELLQSNVKPKADPMMNAEMEQAQKLRIAEIELWLLEQRINRKV